MDILCVRAKSSRQKGVRRKFEIGKTLILFIRPKMSIDYRTELIAGQKISLCDACIKSMCQSFKSSNIGERYCYSLDKNKSRSNIIHEYPDRKRFTLVNMGWKYGKHVKLSNTDRKAFLNMVSKGSFGIVLDNDKNDK